MENQDDSTEIELCSTVRVIINPDKERSNSLKKRIEEAPNLLNINASASKSCSIFRVPQNIMELHPNSFQPAIVSIGPYHHGEERLQNMELHKCRLLGVFLGYIEQLGVVLDHLLESVREKEDEIRRCYSQNIGNYTSDELVEMMVLDGCFIVKLLCVVGRIIIPKSDDPVFNTPFMLSSLTRDLVMLENQIPFFVLEMLYDKCVADHVEDRVPLQELVLKLMNYSLPRYSQASDLCDKYKNFSGQHILDFYRSTYIPSLRIDCQEKSLCRRLCCFFATLRGEENATDQRDSPLPQKEKKFQLWLKKRVKQLGGLVGIKFKKEKTDTNESLLRFIQPVETLIKAGIKFEKREDTDSFIDIDFNHRTLKIPRLVTGELMKCFILNCIVFEQCYKHRSKHFISYLNFMGHLINTTFDARYLREKKIVENFFGTDEELVNFFNEIAKNMPYYFNKDYLVKVAEKVEIYYRNARHVGWAEFKYKYCRSVWICLSAVAALLVVVLTAVQTFYAVYGYHNPND